MRQAILVPGGQIQAIEGKQTGWCPKKWVWLKPQR